jgi:SulP family sulfate permease
VAGLLPATSDYAAVPGTWRSDLVAGLTVGVVALPLALGFGITSGLGAQAGLVTAIVAGLVAAVFGGSNVQVSGPTGAMTVVLVPVVAQFGASGVVVVGLLAGLALVIAALAGLGRFLAYIPWPVVEGFTLGIAVIIFLQQVPAALGVPKPPGENTAAVALRAVSDALQGAGNGSAIIVVIVVATVMTVVARVHRAIPGSLLAIVIATVMVEAADMPVAPIGSLPSSIPMPSLPGLSGLRLGELVSAALAVALLAGLESLLSAKVADGMSDAPAHDPDRELFGQGLANLASPLFGGMPATGAIARTAVNVRSGGRTRLAALTHALALVLVVYLGGSLVARIPLAALAGVLMVTAVRMIDVHAVRMVVRSTRGDAIVLVLTAVATVAFDLIVAVEIGLAVAALLALRAIARNTSFVAERVAPLDPTDVVDPDEESALLSEHILTYRIDGALFFGAAQRFLAEFTAIDGVDVVILRLPELQHLDATGAQALGEIVEQLEARHVTVLVKGPRPEHLKVLEVVGTLDRLAHERHLFDDLDDAIAHARLHVARARRDVA